MRTKISRGIITEIGKAGVSLRGTGPGNNGLLRKEYSHAYRSTTLALAFAAGTGVYKARLAFDRNRSLAAVTLGCVRKI